MYLVFNLPLLLYHEYILNKYKPSVASITLVTFYAKLGIKDCSSFSGFLFIAFSL